MTTATSPSRSRRAMIEAHGLIECYGPSIAVNGLSFSIRPGLVTGFLGPNGATPAVLSVTQCGPTTELW